MEVSTHIFLSYAREDEVKVEILYHKLSGEGLSPWMDTKNILPGEKWRLSIPRAIRSSDFFLACLSAKSFNKRGLLQKEIQEALDICKEKLEDDIYLIPVRLEPCPVPHILREHQWVDLFDKDGFERLIEAIRIQLGKNGMEVVNEDSSSKPVLEDLAARQGVPHQEGITRSSSTIERFSLSDLQELIGQAVDDYVIENILGSGYDTVVFLAHHKGLQLRIALRVYGLLTTSSVDLDQALNEVRRRSLLNHPSVLKIYAPGIAELEFQGSPRQILYIPMQYAPSGNSEQNPPLKDKQISLRDIEALIGLMDGLNAIHESGIIHLDVKPTNILQFQERSGGEDATVFRIADFGVAEVGSAVPKTAEPGAYPDPYTPPEHLKGVFSKKSDVYSMGATFFYMLTGRDPFPIRAEDGASPRAQRLQNRPNAMDYNPRCPPRLALLVIQMMSVNAGDRPSTEECIERLRDIKESITRKVFGFPVPPKLEKFLSSEELRIWYTPDFQGIFKPEVHLLFGSSLYAIRFKMAHPIFSQYKRLLEYMARTFSDCFSMYETYGSYDLHIFVWADPEQITDLQRTVKRVFPDTVAEVAHAKNFHHIHSNDFQSDDSVTLVGAVAVQEGLDLPTVDRRNYLCGKYPHEAPDRSIRAFTYVNQVVGAPVDHAFLRVAIVEGVRRRMLELVSQVDDQGKRRFPRISFMELSTDNRNPNEPVALVNFVAKDYKFLHQVPIAITELGDSAVAAPTFLETGRIVIQSDKILF